MSVASIRREMRRRRHRERAMAATVIALGLSYPVAGLMSFARAAPSSATGLMGELQACADRAALAPLEAGDVADECREIRIRTNRAP